MNPILGAASGAYSPVKPNAVDPNARPPQADGGIAERAGTPAVRGGDAAVSPGDASASPSTSAALDPARIGHRIDRLIEGQVATGGLTRDQAGVLKRVLSTGTRGSDGTDAPPANSSEASDPVSRAAAGTPAAGDASRPSPSQTLAAFIQTLQSGQDRTVAYGSDGAKESARLTSSTLLDFNT